MSTENLNLLIKNMYLKKVKTKDNVSRIAHHRVSDLMMMRYDPMMMRYDPMMMRYDPMMARYDPMTMRYDPMMMRYE